MRFGSDAFRPLLVAFAVVFLTCIGPASAQQESGSDPTAMSVQESELLRELGRIQGRITIPDERLAILQQPQGREYRRFHESWLPWIGGIAIIGMILALAAFYLSRGPIRMAPEEHSGRSVLRFNTFERFNHWMIATSFIVLTFTGLNYFLGKRLLMPLLGPDAFSTWSHWAKYAHNFVAWPFMLGVILMAVLWLRDNLPDRYDIPWLKAGGGFIGHARPDAGRFNAGQKLIFWAVLFGGGILAASGIALLFPFSLADVNGMQIAQFVHAIMGVTMMAIIIAHIYIGTLGMEGAWDAMGSGRVDLAWALHHHRAWIEERRKAEHAAPPLSRG